MPSVLLRGDTINFSHAQIQKISLGGEGGEEGLGRWGQDMTPFFSHQRILQRDVQTALEMQLDPMSPFTSRGWSVPEFLRKPIAT